jgi:hypothetical protein
MSDIPIQARDSSQESNRAPANLAAGDIAYGRDPQTRQAFTDQNSRAQASFNSLVDDFGKPMFAKSETLLGQAPGSDRSGQPLGGAPTVDQVLNAGQQRANQDTVAQMQLMADRADKSLGLQGQLPLTTDQEQLDQHHHGKPHRGGGGRGRTRDDALAAQLTDKNNKFGPNETAKDLGLLSDSLSAVGKLNNPNAAESAMGNLIKMAGNSNPFATDSLAASLVAGDAQNQWLNTRMAQQGDSVRPVVVPDLHPELSLQLKNQAADALINIGDTRGGLGRSDQMALAMAMGQALHNKANGDVSQANEKLLNTTSSYFVRMLGGDKGAEGSGSAQQRAAMSANMRNAIDGLNDAVKAKVPGADSIARMLGQFGGTESEASRLTEASEASSQSAKKKRENDATAVTKSVKEVQNQPNLLKSIWEKLNGLFKDVESDKRKARRDGADALDAASKSEILKNCDIANGRRSQGLIAGLNSRQFEEEQTESHSAMRASFKVGERTNLVKLDSGRSFDPVLNRYFKRVGSTMVEDDKPATEQEKGQIADFMDNQKDQPAAFLGRMQSNAQLNNQNQGQSLVQSGTSAVSSNR